MRSWPPTRVLRSTGVSDEDVFILGKELQAGVYDMVVPSPLVEAGVGHLNFWKEDMGKLIHGMHAFKDQRAWMGFSWILNFIILCNLLLSIGLHHENTKTYDPLHSSESNGD